MSHQNVATLEKRCVVSNMIISSAFDTFQTPFDFRRAVALGGPNSTTRTVDLIIGRDYPIEVRWYGNLKVTGWLGRSQGRELELEAPAARECILQQYIASSQQIPVLDQSWLCAVL